MKKDLEWLEQARAALPVQREQSFIRTTTSLERGKQLADFISDRVLPEFTQPDILIVGVGAANNPLWCPAVPFFASARLERLHTPYTLDLFDFDKRILEDIKTRRHLYLWNTQFEARPSVRENWEAYLQEINQPDEIVYAEDPDIKFEVEFDPQLQISGKSREFFLRDGIRKAPIPANFRRLLASGVINLRQGDIAQTELDEERYSLADCSYVLYQLTPEAQQVAVANMAKSLKPRGLLRIHDFGGQRGTTPIFTEFGGWLEKTHLDDLGLAEVEFKRVGGSGAKRNGRPLPDAIETAFQKIA